MSESRISFREIRDSFYLPDGLFADHMPERSGRPQVITTAPVRDSKIQRWLQYTNCRNYWHCRRRHSYSKAWYGKYHDTVHILKLTPASKPVHKMCPYISWSEVFSRLHRFGCRLWRSHRRQPQSRAFPESSTPRRPCPQPRRNRFPVRAGASGKFVAHSMP